MASDAQSFRLEAARSQCRVGTDKPIYTATLSYGHFGRRPEASGAFSWERTDLADELRRAFWGRERGIAASTAVLWATARPAFALRSARAMLLAGGSR
jgi:hypothetical protein